ncbi:MAG TPA: hypothetical protein VMD08_16275 [Candidatus Baltobacteraceae bacterium]|nr:hypothetical protein [Candidatus Baltobacteraceae bacterium]
MTKRMLVGIALSVLVFSVAGCAGSTGTTTQKAVLDDFSNRATRGQVWVYWNCSKQDGVLTVEGVAVQPGYPSPTRDLKFTLEGVDGRGTVVSKGQAAAQDLIMYQMEQNPFRVAVRTVGAENRFNLTYTYWLHVAGTVVDADSDEHEVVARNACPAR